MLFLHALLLNSASSSAVRGQSSCDASSVFLSQGMDGREEGLASAEQESSHWAEHDALRLSTYLIVGWFQVQTRRKKKL